HMGHAFQHTLQDALIRYHRMRGFDTLWQMGTDHAGIATEMVVGRNLAAAGLARDELGREAFIERVWDWKRESGDTIERQMRRLGASGDWSRTVFTMDAGASEAVIEAFVRMHEQGLIYRGKRLVNWDPVLKTAISDLEVVSEEEDGFLWSILYPFADQSLRGPDGETGLIVATTRPETMLGDVAVAVHPEDERYAHLVGKTLRLPLSEREIPIIADTYVEREFGTGCVKITPAHDFNDYAIGQRHGLPTLNIFTPNAAINEDAPPTYRGLDRYAARKQVLADLEDSGLLVETKKHKLQVPRGDRTGQVLEPYLTDQLFVRMEGLAARGLALVESGEIEFVPPNWVSTYRHWLGNIQDWCISRQLWWGHRIPAWYAEDGRIFVGRDEPEVRAKNALRADVALRQDNDVLETWFSSGLWPFSTLGWPDADAMTARGYDRFLPSSVLVTGFDIIFFWVARMIMLSDHLTGRVPFKQVYITGLVRDRDGQKMSKSKGNILDPLDLIDGIDFESLVTKRTSGLMQPAMAAKIEKSTRKEFPAGIPAFGADALRFTFASLASHGRDIKFDLARCEGYKNFCNKLWNAARFVLMHTESFRLPSPSALPPSPAGRGETVTDAEKWILSRLALTCAEVETQFAAYRFDLAAQALYEFTWNEFCDWFLELAKPALMADAVDASPIVEHAMAAASTRRTLLHVLETTLRLLHPLLPFVTEEIWFEVAPRLGFGANREAGDSISLRPYPTAGEFAGDHVRAAGDVEWLKAVVTQLRRIRSEMNVSPARAVSLLLADGNAIDRERMLRFGSSLRFLAKVESIEWLDDGAEPPPAATGVVGGLRVLIPLAGLIDLGAERQRLARELVRIAGEVAKSEAKLGSETFVANAPAAVVATERTRLAEWQTQHATLTAQLARLA
ncbi:MAG: valine--tRNA ligase, partial [Lysobacterales bacterium]